MSLSLISKYRKALMGVATLWIAFYHSRFPFTLKITNFFLATCGYCGVDLFLFLSSFGLYYSLKKETSIIKFYKKRLLRILPYSIPMCFVIMFLQDRTIGQTLIDTSGLTIWLSHSLTYWFTSLILFLYLITPFYLKLFNKKPFLVTLISIVVVTVFCVCSSEFETKYVFFRLCVFFLGFYFAYLNDTSGNNKLICFISILAMLIGWAYMYYLIHNCGNIQHVYPMLLITPGLLLLFTYIFSKLEIINKLFSIMGGYSFQFYLIHEPLVILLYEYYGKLYIPRIGFDWLINIVGIFIAFILSILFKKIVDKTVKNFLH